MVVQGNHTHGFHEQGVSEKLPSPLQKPLWVIKGDTWQPTFLGEASGWSKAEGNVKLYHSYVPNDLELTIPAAVSPAWLLRKHTWKITANQF